MSCHTNCRDCGSIPHDGFIRVGCNKCCADFCANCGRKCPRCKTNIICQCTTSVMCSECLIAFFSTKCQISIEQAITEVKQSLKN